MGEKVCFRCGSKKLRRVNRIGFLQTTVLPFFGFFPWECVMCRHKRFLRDDGRSSGFGSHA